MNKPDEGHILTDKELSELEKRISSVYSEAAKELQSTIDDYFAKFEKRDAEMKALIGTIQNGKEWTESDYKQWRLAQIGRGERFEALRDKVAERMTKANQVAVSYVNDATPGIYSLNRNYAAYTIEQVAGDVCFTMWDESTVKRIIKGDPDLMPYYQEKRAVNRGIDLAYGKRQISASVTSSILQGKSIKGMADDLQTRIPTMNRDSAIRTARTAVTGAQNAGRLDSYIAAEKMGIEMEREWVSTLDNRTRDEHKLADGQVVGVDEPFVVGGEKLMYPGDRSGSPWNVYNCRCTMIAKVKGVDTSDAQRRARDPETGESVLISDMSYSEWAGWKGALQEDVSNAIIEKKTSVVYRMFDTGEQVNDFFYYDGEERGLLARKRSQYGQWEKALTDDQKSAIDAYTTGGYADLNDFLRKRGDWQDIDAEAMTAFRGDLRAAISEFDLKEPIKVYRYTGKNTFGGEKIENLIGREWSDAGFMSTSPAMQGIESAVVTGKDYLLEIDVPGGKGIGAYLNNLSPWKDTEYEFLLKDGTNFEITGVDTSGDKPIIKMVVKA